MEHRDIAPRFKSSPPADSTIAAAADGGVLNPDNSPNHAPKSPISDLEGSINAIKAECERALTALRRGDHTKALSLMKDLCLNHENSPHSALIHRIQGTVCVNVASIIDDPDAKQMHLKNAIESARQADSTAAADGGASNPDNSPNHAPKSPILNLEGTINGDNNANPCSPDASVKVDCERALTALRRGNHRKALRLMKDLCFKHENSPHSALIHRVQGTVCVKVASIIDDPTAKQRHLKNAVESARKAVSLSPNSIEFSHFYANLLYEAANDGKDYEEVVQECDRGLLIKTPVDPAKESLQEENQQKITTPEARVAHVQNELRSLIQKTNIASISSWMKNLNTGEEKFRLVPIRRVPEDPMELRLVQTRRPNAIKKATKTPEERRKEIEVRVAAARLLQHRSESPHLGNDVDSSKEIAPRSKPSQPTSPPAESTSVAADGGDSNPDNSPNHAPKSPILDLEGISNGDNNANPCSPDASVKVECEQALTALRRGDHTKALSLMKDLCLKHENSLHSALIHRVQGTVCVKVASIIDDPTVKQRHLKNAVESARKAVSLSPNSIEFSHFYANLLYEAANDEKDYEEVVQECDRGLLIKTPVDPAKESLQEDSRQRITTPEARVAHVQNELRSLIQKANIASISSWMKNLNTGEEKFQLIPIRRVPEDPMVQTRRPNEVKRPTKTPEERRREIEVRVAAAKLLQHKSESPNQDGDIVGSKVQHLQGSSSVLSKASAVDSRQANKSTRKRLLLAQ